MDAALVEPLDVVDRFEVVDFMRGMMSGIGPVSVFTFRRLGFRGFVVAFFLGGDIKAATLSCDSFWRKD